MDRIFDFLEQHRLDDALSAEAYEQAGAVLRGLFKQQIAAQHRLVEQRLPATAETREILYGNEACALVARPAPWCLILHDPAYAAAPRALAAAVPALLAGVPEVWAVGLRPAGGKAAPAPLLLAAWELAGLENVALAPERDLLPLLPEILNQGGPAGPGRVLVLGSPAWGGALCAALAEESRVLARREGRPPKILLAGRDAAARQDLLRTLHPDATLVLDEGFAALSQADAWHNAVFFNPADLEKALAIPAALHLDYAQAATWVWPELGRDFFLNHRAAFYSCPAYA